MSFRKLAYETNYIKKIIFNVLSISLIIYGLYSGFLNQIPQEVSFFIIFLGSILLIIYWIRKRRLIGKHRETAEQVKEMFRPKTLYERFQERDASEEIGRVLAGLRKKFGEGFIEIDAKIIIAAERGIVDPKKVSIYLNEDKKKIKNRIKFLNNKISHLE